MHPATNWAHILVLVESFVGLVETAIVTAVLFSKFSRPKARVEFAEYAVLFESQGRLYLQIRFANARGYAIVNGKLHLSALVNQKDQHGNPIRRMISLPSYNPTFLSLVSVLLLHIVYRTECLPEEQ